MYTEQVTRARQNFADRNPASRAYYDEARKYMPGGHTRTVLTHAPFPLNFVAGSGATLRDADGHEYIDLLGDYTAGLLGHSEHRVIDAVTTALNTNVSVGGIHPAEARLAKLMCERFEIDRVRFTNSGTEANLMAITTAMMATRRKKFLVFLGGYHGGVLYFASGPAPWNAPYEFVIAPYNDLPGTLALIEEHGETLAAVIMEAMLGSGGCVPADGEFVRGVAAAARAKGALFVADEVMTSRHGRKGMMDLLGVTPDITTYGKYIGGGFSFGAFGGKAEYLDQYDTSPEGGRTETISHAGTFNNNVSTMTAGGVVLGEVFTADVAEAHTARGNDFRENVAALCARHSTPVSVSGFGSMMSLHGLRTAPTTPREGWKRNNDINELLFLGLLERGVYIAARGMMNVGLAHTDEQLATALDRLDDLLSELDAL
ncbi:MAG: aminotransferase class III-fold pyridoxal phosphate-dependent enzyme [Ilumatobacteraceae bacterium]